MANALEKMSLDLLGLPAASRAALAAKLLASLDELEDPESEKLWIAEAKKRLKEMRENKISHRSADKVLRSAHAKLRS